MRNKGLTLLELALVLVIMGLLIGATLPLISDLAKYKHYQATKNRLEEIKKALVGYALMHNRLPAADTDNDGQENTRATRGSLPYISLSVGPTDDWHNSFFYDVNANLTTTSTKTELCQALQNISGRSYPQISINGSASVPTVLVVISKGENGSLDEENGDGDRVYESQTPTETFDDLVIYISPIYLYDELGCR
ncbi:MAG: prepilin-type N-terminal cleavage/methylation domain-containing protein [Candidatus Desulfofervidaceae bacterium]|nr:prepilin-type N-terminal cleavage/methylation domain-containing protein [Candidatus Desulfofervidaceae bacterium]